MLIWVGVFQTLLVSQLLGAFQFPDPGEDNVRAANVPLSHGVLCCFPLLQVSVGQLPFRDCPRAAASTRAMS